MRITAVVLTFRRRKMVMECVAALVEQVRALDGILVVDNAAEPDLAAMLDERFGGAVQYLPMPENVGSAGGYAAGTMWAWRNGFDWAWLMDDDCQPLPDALSRLCAAAAAYPGASALVSCHLNREGQPVGTAAGHFHWAACRLAVLRPEECGQSIRRVDAASSSGMFLRLECLHRAGLQNPALFTQEDSEFSWRLSACGPIYHVGDSRVVRKIDDQGWQVRRRGYWRAPAPLFWRTYYVFRNHVAFFLEARPGARTAARMAWRYLHAVAGVLVLDDHRLFRLRILTRAFLDGWRGRLGKTLDPDTFWTAS